MRILTITKDLASGGQQRTAQNFVLGYQERGHENAVFSVLAGGPRAEVLREAGVPIFTGSNAPEDREATARQAAHWQPDVIHLHSKGAMMPAMAEALQALQSALPEPRPVIESNSFGRPDYQHECRLVDVHMLKSRWMLWKWRKWTQHLQPRPIGTVIPNTVDTDSFYPAPQEEQRAFRNEHGVPPEAFVFGCVARPSDLKWPPILFQAFARVAAERPDVYLMAAGLTSRARDRVGKMKPQARRRIVELPFMESDRVLRTCYSSMDVFLHACTAGESFGMIFVESMACKTPIITLNTPAKNNSQLEVVGHERGGLIANDRRSMIEAMQRLMDDAPLRRQLAEDGAEHVRSTYTLEQVMPRLLHLAKIADRADTREDLEEALLENTAFPTEVSDKDVNYLLANTLGRVSLTQRALMRLVHRPRLYRLWHRLRFGY
jgi:glycosyltransferase involved in cell wall biosynthesis